MSAAPSAGSVSNAAPSTPAPTAQPLDPHQAASGSALNLDTTQILNLLRHLPVFNNKPAPNAHGHGATSLGLTEHDISNAQALAAVADKASIQSHEPGPNSHPHGPPSLGLPGQEVTNASPGDKTTGSSDEGTRSAAPVASAGRRRSTHVNANGVVIGSEEWTRQRKDNHKEVERRRRGNINEGINELARIVPNGTGEKAKGAILSRACQYIHHLKDNEARNIEKWTLEKLLMDQAMGDMQAQLEEVRRMWEEEHAKRELLEAELATLRGVKRDETKKRPADDSDEPASTSDGKSKDDDRGKRPRTE